MASYCIYESDLRQPEDRLVCCVRDRDVCQKRVAALNAAALRMAVLPPDRAADGLPVPLYYVLRAGTGDTARPAP